MHNFIIVTWPIHFCLCNNFCFVLCCICFGFVLIVIVINLLVNFCVVFKLVIATCMHVYMCSIGAGGR